MCAPRSVYSWDVVITRAGGKLFFDRRDDSAVDLLTTAETAPEVGPCLDCWMCGTASQVSHMWLVLSPAKPASLAWYTSGCSPRQHQAAFARKQSHTSQLHLRYELSWAAAVMLACDEIIGAEGGSLGSG